MSELKLSITLWEDIYGKYIIYLPNIFILGLLKASATANKRKQNSPLKQKLFYIKQLLKEEWPNLQYAMEENTLEYITAFWWSINLTKA